MKNFAKIIAISGVLIAFAIVGQALFYAPNGDSGLSVYSRSNMGSVIEAATTSPNDYPARLIIPKLGIDTDVQHVGVTKSGNMAAPNNFTDVSWYKFGTVPGNTGSAALAGHQDNALSLDGVFKYLHNLETGDDVYVIDKSGEKLHFQVIDEQIYPYNDSPLEKIFGAKDGTYLNLITCAGKWLASAKTNDKRLVIYTKLVR